MLFKVIFFDPQYSITQIIILSSISNSMMHNISCLVIIGSVDGCVEMGWDTNS